MIKLQKKWYKRQEIFENLDNIYVFGDNTQRVGLGGQAKEARGEYNVIGVVTKWDPGIREDSYFNEETHSPFTLIAIVSDDLGRVDQALNKGVDVIWPYDNIGTGLSKLPQLAPVTYQFICSTVAYFCDKYGCAVEDGIAPEWVYWNDNRN